MPKQSSSKRSTDKFVDGKIQKKQPRSNRSSNCRNDSLTPSEVHENFIQIMTDISKESSKWFDRFIRSSDEMDEAMEETRPSKRNMKLIEEKTEEYEKALKQLRRYQSKEKKELKKYEDYLRSTQNS